MISATANDVIPVWPGDVPESEFWQDVGPELEQPRWENSRLVRNVSDPTLTVFLPNTVVANGTYAVWGEQAKPDDAPPLFLAHASDDPLVSPQESVKLYSAWQQAGRRAEMHVYAEGGHGFALWPQGLPSDTWIDRFWDWLRAEGFVPRP